ncbi:unnamed protein product, partial [Protopolystoma xenopodis]
STPSIRDSNHEPDEAEYAAAACAAVESVVSALVGHRPPDPLRRVDPSLEGTGTDRLFSLSLAPRLIEPTVSACRTLPASGIRRSFLHIDGLQADIGRDEEDGEEEDGEEDEDDEEEEEEGATLRGGNFHVDHSSLSTNGLLKSVGESDLGSPSIPGRSLSGALIAHSQSQQQQQQLQSAVATTACLMAPNEHFPCSVCGKPFQAKALLLKHRIVHDEPKHICNTCGRCFVREDKLKRHVMSIHTLEKPHVCTICTKAFSRKFN